MSKAIKALELKGFVKTYNDIGTRRYLIRDPRLAMSRLREMKVMSTEDFEDANSLLDVLSQALVDDPLRKDLSGVK